MEGTRSHGVGSWGHSTNPGQDCAISALGAQGVEGQGTLRARGFGQKEKQRAARADRGFQPSPQTSPGHRGAPAPISLANPVLGPGQPASSPAGGTCGQH